MEDVIFAYLLSTAPRRRKLGIFDRGPMENKYLLSSNFRQLEADRR
jgi:hypothetical protein